jgi:hypothetical protein
MQSHMLRAQEGNNYEIAWSSHRPPTHDAIRSSLGVIPALRGTIIKPLSISKRSLWKDVKDAWPLHLAVVVLTAGLAIPVYVGIALWECRTPLWIITFAVYPRRNPLLSTAPPVPQDTLPTALPHTEAPPPVAPLPDAVVHS